ncbi:MAG TPA: sulfatase-like hydrolase/transferase, partial [Myxococcota bacterium]|nr:sulfatase-like hydrolase/transferase [Myxococcota bacterium]
MVIGLLLGACVPAAPPDGIPERAVILVMDGVSGLDVLREGDSRFRNGSIWGLTPDLRRELLPVATQVTLAENTAAPITSPAHWDLITGRHVGLAQFGSDQGPGAYVSAWPTIFNAAQAAGASADQTWIVSNGKLLLQLSHSLSPGSEDPRLLYPEGDVDDATVLEQALEVLQTEKPKMLLVNAHRVDHYGHSQRQQSYVESLREIDAGFLAIWRWINEDPDYAGRTVLAIVSDHGRHLDGVENGWQSHGDACGGCRSIPMVLAGPGIPDGEQWEEPWDLIDVAPTLASLTGWTMPYAQGLPMAGTGASRRGEVEATGEIFVSFLTEVDRRTELRDEMGRISREESREARGPVQAGALLCWRELGQGGDWDPWQPRCAQGTGTGQAVKEVG